MDPKYIPKLKRNVPRVFCDAIQETYQFAYSRAWEVALSEFESNQRWMFGFGRWSKIDDATVDAATRAGLSFNKIPAANGMTHVEVYTPEFIIVPRKGSDRNDGEWPKYRNHLTARNTPKELSLFGGPGDIEAIAREEDERLFVEIVHVPATDDPSIVGSIWLVIPDEKGDPLAYLPLNKLYPGEDTEMAELR